MSVSCMAGLPVELTVVVRFRRSFCREDRQEKQQAHDGIALNMMSVKEMKSQLLLKTILSVCGYAVQSVMDPRIDLLEEHNESPH